MYTLYIANKNYSSWSLRPWILLTELDITFDEQLVAFDDGNSYTKFRSFSPTGLVPCLIDGQTVVWESLAIIEYLAEQHPSVWPEDKIARAWARSAAAEMHAGFNSLRNTCPMTVGLRIKLNTIEPGLTKDLDRLSELWNEGIERFGGPFLGGDQFSAVDAFFAPVAFRLQTYGLSVTGACATYPARLIELPGMQDWQTSALNETLREPSHEQEIKQLGEWLEDFRK